MNVHDAKTHLEKLLARVEEGEEIVIAKAGKPVAKLTSVKTQQARVPGMDEGHVWISPDFDKFSIEVDGDWHGSGVSLARKNEGVVGYSRISLVDVAASLPVA